jgi:hypothetical protein
MKIHPTDERYNRFKTTTRIKNLTSGFLMTQIKTLQIELNMSKDEAVNFLKDVTENLRQEKLFSDDNNFNFNGR